MNILGPGDGYTLNGLGNSTSSEDPTWFEYTIYDSTEGCADWGNTPSETSIDGRLSAKFRVALNIKYQDTEKPNVEIKPFYWNSKTENSVSWTDDAEPVAEGHIELEGDLTNAIKTVLGEDDPKVSGKIKVEGYAFDDIKLKELYVKFEGHSDLDTAQTASTYNGTWSTQDYADGWGFEAEENTMALGASGSGSVTTVGEGPPTSSSLEQLANATRATAAKNNTLFIIITFKPLKYFKSNKNC